MNNRNARCWWYNEVYALYVPNGPYVDLAS